MFAKARLKLTLWYVLIIMSVSVLFSLAVYHGLSAELGRNIRHVSLRMPPQNELLPLPFRAPPVLIGFEESLLTESKERITIELVLINTAILIVSGLAAFFLAGRTLKPIEKMVEEQKRFVADASHELRTPLTALKTEIEVSLRDKKLNLHRARDLLLSNLEEVDKIQALTNYLLSLGRYQTSQAKLPFETVDLHSILDETVEKAQSLAYEKKITIRLDGKALKIQANPTSLSELATILLDNAIKYSHQGGNILLKLRSDHKYAAFSAQDFGIGIKPSDLPYIFDRFYRADASRSKDQTDGYGLGLSIAKNIVESHHGKITVESTPNVGSTFTVRLPLKQSKYS